MYDSQPLKLIVLISLAVILASCSAPQSLPSEGPTPIPTLIPVTAPVISVMLTEEPTSVIQSYPAGIPSAEAGEPVYFEHCAECHGVDGSGVVTGARDFNDLDFMRGETPAFFYSVISEGGDEMPAFQNRLSSDERWDLVFYIWSFSTNAERLTEGQNLYNENCATCHGIDGIGEVLGAADFTDLRYIADQAPRDFYLAVTQGVGSMPAWQGRLSQDARWTVIEYLNAFSYEPLVEFVVEETPDPEVVVVEEGCHPLYFVQTNPFAWDDAEVIEAGRFIYDQSCADCHAADGSGALSNTPDFTTAESRDYLLNNSGENLCAIAEGENTMPGWLDTMSFDDMWRTLTYIASLSSN